MNPKINERVRLIGVAFDKGAGTPGVALGPAALRYAGIVKRLENIGYKVEDIGDITIDNNLPENDKSLNLKNLNEVININEKLIKEVESALKDGAFPVILGGDHSIAIGSVNGAMSKSNNIGLLWFDAHGDINTPETSPSGNIHGMPMAALTGIAHPLLNNIGGPDRKLDPTKIVLVGARDLDSGERKLFKEMGVTVFTMHEIDSYGIGKVTEEALKIVNDKTDGFYLSFDVDGVDPDLIQGTGTRVPGGLNYREANYFMEIISKDERLIGMDLVEVNPLLDIRNTTAENAIIFLGSLMGEWLL